MKQELEILKLTADAVAGLRLCLTSFTQLLFKDFKLFYSFWVAQACKTVAVVSEMIISDLL